VAGKSLARKPGVFGITAEGPTHQFNLAVNGRGHAVDGADKRPASPTNHAHSHFSIHKSPVD
jgi:hypothetical protein